MKDDDFSVRSLHDRAVLAVDARSRRSFARHSHDEFGVGLLTSGAQRSWSGRGPVEAICGNLITVNPSEMHDGAPVGSERSWSMLYISQRIVASIVADLSEGALYTGEFHAPVIKDARLTRLFVSTRKAALEGYQRMQFEQQLMMLLGRLFEAVPKAKVDNPHRVMQVRERIDDDPAHPYTLAELATLSTLSRFQTLRAFTRLTGLTPHAYLIQRRLEVARRLIRNGSTLANAAADAGFADQSHMHRIFIARYGFTPGTYAAAYRP